jgi:hypothetical protein
MRFILSILFHEVAIEFAAWGWRRNCVREHVVIGRDGRKRIRRSFVAWPVK